jgi:hypothetical protein
MTDPTTPETQPAPSRAEFQFGLDAFLWMFVVVAVFLGYIRTFHAEDVGRFVVVATLTVVVGGAIGLVAHRFSAAVFWAGIGVVGGYLAIVHSPFNHWSQQYAWPLTSGIAGAVAAACGDGNLRRRMAAPAIVWCVLATVYDLSVFGLRWDFMLEPVCAFLCGLLAGLAIDLASRFEKWTSIPRHFFALGLVLAAIGGHWVAIRLIPGV